MVFISLFYRMILSKKSATFVDHALAIDQSKIWHCRSAV